jgi:hypothetical protein
MAGNFKRYNAFFLIILGNFHVTLDVLGAPAPIINDIGFARAHGRRDTDKG